MELKEKIRIFQYELLSWYAVNGRKFPWRKDDLTSYEYIISEVLLQRTKAETVAFFFQFLLINTKTGQV